MRPRRLGGIVMLLVLSGCAQPSLNDADAADAVKGIPGVLGARSDCSNPLGGEPDCTLVVDVLPDLSAAKIRKVVDKSWPSLVDDVYNLRIVSDGVSVSMNVGRREVNEIGVDTLLTMRGLEHVTEGSIEIRGSGVNRVEAVTDSFDAGLEIATALRSDEFLDVNVTGDALQLATANGFPTAEFAFARQVPKAVKGVVSKVRIEPGSVIVYCTGEAAQQEAKKVVPGLPGYARAGLVEVFQDAP
ncbi:MAG: hypothetical protein ABIN55_09950 [Aeromicrobium sp.]